MPSKSGLETVYPFPDLSILAYHVQLPVELCVDLRLSCGCALLIPPTWHVPMTSTS